jgi:hypothetical protein
MRIAFIERPERMILIPRLLKSLFLDFEKGR